MIDPKVFKQVRKALGLTQAELADAIGLSRITINKMERGHLVRGIPDEIAERLMALKPRPNVKANTYVLCAGCPRPDDCRKERRCWESAQRPLVNVDDGHLWDNEEEDDS